MFNFFRLNKSRKIEDETESAPQVSDVFFDSKKTFLNLRGRIPIIQIDWQRVNFFLRLHKHALVILLLTFLVGTIIGSFRVSRADIAYFYPKSCLGGWEHPEYAANEPSLLEGAQLEDFNKSNSAFLSSVSTLYCGGFTGEIPENKEPKKFIVTLSWSLDDGSVIHKEPEPFLNTVNNSNSSLTEENKAVEEIIIENKESSETEVSQEPSAEIIENAQGASEPVVNTEVPVDSPPAQVDAPTSTEQSFLGTFFINRAFAQENIETPKEELPVLIETQENILAPQEQSQAEVLTQEEVSLDQVMRVSYTLDGTTWNIVKDVSRANWRSTTFEIPITDWADIENLQIAVSPIFSIDTPPVVYVDAVILAVEYGELLEGEPDSQPDFAKDTILYDETFEDVRVIKILRGEIPMIWYTRIPPQKVEEKVSEVGDVVSEQTIPEAEPSYFPQEESTQQILEPIVSEETSGIVEEIISWLLPSSVFAQEEAPSAPETQPVIEVLSESAVPTEEPAVSETSNTESVSTQTTEENTTTATEDIINTISNSFEGVIDLNNVIVDAPPIQINVNDVTTTEQIITNVVPIVYTQEQIKKEYAKYLEWNLVAEGEIVDIATPVTFSNPIIFWFSKDKTALYQYNIISGGISSESVETEEKASEASFLKPNGDVETVILSEDKTEITTPEDETYEAKKEELDIIVEEVPIQNNAN